MGGLVEPNLVIRADTENVKMYVSRIAFNQTVEDRMRNDAKYRRAIEKKARPVLSVVRKKTDAELMAWWEEHGLKIDEGSFKALAERFASAEELADWYCQVELSCAVEPPDNGVRRSVFCTSWGQIGPRVLNLTIPGSTVEGYGGTVDRVWSASGVTGLEVELRRAEETLVGIGGSQRKTERGSEFVCSADLAWAGGRRRCGGVQGCGRHLDACGVEVSESGIWRG